MNSRLIASCCSVRKSTTSWLVEMALSVFGMGNLSVEVCEGEAR